MDNQSTLLIDETPLASALRREGRGRSLRVLVVEDDAVAAHIACELLRALDSEVEHVSDAESAMARLTSAPPDLVLVDIGLPGASGIELVRASQARRPELPHVMISSRSEVEDVIGAIRHGAEDYIVKPLTGEKLKSALERVLNRPRPVVDAPRQRVLAIGAHPDDVEIGVGGTLRRHSAEGDDVTILTLTGGEQGGDSSRRVQEARRAAEILGCRLVIESLEDTMIGAGPATIQVITGAVERFDPTVIYTHTANDVHQDHRGAHAATMIAARRVPRIYAYQAPSTNIDFRPTKFVQIDEYLTAKLDAIAAHASQSGRAYLQEDLMRSTARYWGRFAGGGLVEPLEVARHADVEVAGSRRADSLLSTTMETP